MKMGEIKIPVEFHYEIPLFRYNNFDVFQVYDFFLGDKTLKLRGKVIGYHRSQWYKYFYPELQFRAVKSLPGAVGPATAP